MMLTRFAAATACLAMTAAAAAQVPVLGGQTSVLLDTATLSSAASLNLSSVSSDVIAPGNLGAGSVAFPINPRNGASLQTTFLYEPGLSSFSGTIEHTGSVLFNNDTVEVGNFTIGFDAARANNGRSGFFVESTTGIPAILFDVGAPTTLVADTSELTIGADVLVSPEFAAFLQANQLATTDLTGADVGDALVEAVVPEPTAVTLLGLGGLGLLRRRR